MKYCLAIQRIDKANIREIEDLNDRPFYDLVMLIDDSFFDNTIMESILTRKNFCQRIEKFFSAEKALKYFQGENYKIPGLIFLDINMPGMDGFEFLEEVKKVTALEDKLNVILFTSSNNINDIEKSKEYSCIKRYIMKPLNVKVLEEIKFWEELKFI